MELIFIKRLCFLILAATCGAQASIAANNEGEVEVFRSAMASQVAAEAYAGMDPEFLASGLAESDIHRIVEAFADACATCVVDAMVSLADLKSIDIELMIDDAKEASVDSKYFDTQEFDRIMLPCFYSAAEKAGMKVR